MPFLPVQNKFQEAIVRFFGSLARYAIGHPRRVLLAAGVVTLAAVPGVLKLKLRTDGQALVPEKAPEVIYDRRIREQFGIEDQIVVLIRSERPEGIFNPATVQLVRDLTSDLARLPGINPSNVMSLATEPSFRSRPGSLLHQTLLEPPLQTRADLDQLRDDLRRIELYTGTLVSEDGKSTAILVGTPTGSDCARLYDQIVQVVQARKPAADDIGVTGSPVAEALLGIQVLEDLGVPSRWLGASTRGQTDKAQWDMPRSLGELRSFVARRFGLVPVTVLVMALVFFLAFRNNVATLLPVPGVVATLIFVFGLMGWCGVPIYLSTAVIPVLLIATGVTNDIYIFSRYFALLRQRPGGDRAQIITETFDQMVAPVACTSLTTGIGFLSFGFSPLKPVQAFGIWAGIGVLFGLFYSLTVVPALLAVINPARLVSNRQLEGNASPSALAAWFSRLGPLIVQRRWWVTGALLLVVALTPLGLRRLTVQDSWTSAFGPQTEFSRVTRLVNENFHGMHLLFVSVEKPEMLRGEVRSTAINRDGLVLPGKLLKHPALIAGSPITISTLEKSGPGSVSNAPTQVLRSHIEMAYGLGGNIATRIPARDIPPDFAQAFSKTDRAAFEVVVHSHVEPELIDAIRDLGNFIRGHPECAVGGVISPADYLSTTRFMARPNDPEARKLPPDAGEIKLMWEYYGLARGQQRLHQIVDTNFWQSLTTVFLKNANFVDTAKLMRELRAYEREQLAPKGTKLGFAGDVASSQALIGAIVTTQLQSLVWSVAGIWLVTALFGGSVRWGLFCVLPSVLAVLVKFAVMGWLGISLGVATSMFAAMTLGIGVNCAIQLLEAYEQARRGGESSPAALNQALVRSGPAALVNTIAVSLGFGVLMLSQVPSNTRLGLLVVIGLVNCFLASLLLLPVLLHWWPFQKIRRPGTEDRNRFRTISKIVAADARRL